MERHLDAAIDKVECLTRDMKPEKQQEQPEMEKEVTEPKTVAVGMVVESEYEYGAEAFEAYQQTAKAETAVKAEVKMTEVKNKSR